MKPTAWINEYDGLEPFNLDNRQDWIPLYAHPAKMPTLVLDGNRVYPTTKTLTDEEIDNLIMDVAEKPTDEDLYDFAKAILKKASGED
jgi:hypothetical protein